MKTLIIVVVLALLGYWGYRHGYIKPEWLGVGVSAPPAGGAGESLHDSLNRGLPRMVGTEVSLDRAVANNAQVAFDYRFIDLDQFGVTQRYGSTLPAEVQGLVVRDLCSNRAVREQVLAKGREIQVQIRARDGRTVFTMPLRPGGC
jgi:hypothetical protein